MYSKTFFVCASLAASALAQQIAFTSLPGTSVEAGKPVSLKWSGGDSTEAVTITLKQGERDNLKTIAIITGDATGNSYTWTPSSSLPNGENYALMISQGNDDTNYSGQFELTGGSSSSGSASASATSSSSNSTANSTTTSAPTIAKASGASSSGTGLPITRNTTLSIATLTASTTQSASTTSGQGSETSSTTTSAPSSTKSAGAASFGSNFALLFAGVAAVAYLG